MNLDSKKEKLKSIIKNYKSLVVAFSGGVDSTFLLATAHEVLKHNLLAVTAVSPIHPKGEIEKAVAFAEQQAISHIVHRSGEMALPEFLANDKNRCYVCKKQLMSDIQSIAANKGISTVAHGANLDDLKDYRPGFKAAEELGIVSPLIDAGFTKSDIRKLSKDFGLETWDKPAQPCLATRIPYGISITKEIIEQIAQAEKVLGDLGITISRVRHHGDSARIEVLEEDFTTILKPDNRHQILERFNKIGYLYVSLDLKGYEQGSMNRTLF